jgi:hypothetical protein
MSAIPTIIQYVPASLEDAGTYCIIEHVIYNLTFVTFVDDYGRGVFITGQIAEQKYLTSYNKKS